MRPLHSQYNKDLLNRMAKSGPKPKNYSGEKFGSLTAMHFVEKNLFRGSKWKFKCECGLEKVILMSSVVSGSTRSCGCKNPGRFVGQKSLFFEGYEGIFKTYWGNIQIRAKERGLSFNLDIKDAWNKFISQDKKCALSGLPIKFSSRCKSYDGNASLDRIDSSKGYEISNVQWVDKRVNRLKWNLKDSDFVKLCTVVGDYNRNKDLEYS